MINYINIVSSTDDFFYASRNQAIFASLGAPRNGDEGSAKVQITLEAGESLTFISASGGVWITGTLVDASSQPIIDIHVP